MKQRDFSIKSSSGKVPGTHCYQLAVRGRIMITVLISVRNAWTELSTKSAAYRRALALTAEAMRTRLSRGMRRMADSEVVQLQLGEAAAAIELATLVLHVRRDESLAILHSGRAITEADILRNRRDITFALHELRRGVERLVEISGARTVYDSDKLQMLVRDIQTITTHYTVSRHAAMVPYGLLLGLPPEAGEA